MRKRNRLFSRWATSRTTAEALVQPACMNGLTQAYPYQE
ncbi:hypothetical protein SAMN05216535_3405 [Stutzerimonas xanthomarina]|uniref:Uncharacterized protein n=2 Tax=Stutzerimonas xanthomarina TaxID=271420 RepID=A0A1M5SN68_9GAMM|nr:hypothetical protein SAMN05216535_3405 [Stutzerimonas xanthomarina]SHH39403.1 hypothetical protein SAMN02744645_3554 [Stutzerimonas xanthomarina DSM 18231]